jgi:hypothetical protein
LGVHPVAVDLYTDTGKKIILVLRFTKEDEEEEEEEEEK